MKTLLSQNPGNRKAMTQKWAVAPQKFVSAMQFNLVPVFVLCYRTKFIFNY